MHTVRRTPRRDLTAITQTFDRLFDDAAFRTMAWAGAPETKLPLDVTSSDESVTVEAALPGIRPEDVEITVHEDNLTIAVKKDEDRADAEGTRVFREVRRVGGSRTLHLPKGMDTDNAVASFDNGMLRLSIPRVEAAKPRTIPVTQVTEAPVMVAAETQAEDESTTEQAQA